MRKRWRFPARPRAWCRCGCASKKAACRLDRTKSSSKSVPWTIRPSWRGSARYSWCDEAPMNPNKMRAQPWYREPWPWILMAGPAAVVVAGFVTAWLAVRSDDGLVMDDYYKEGLAINKTIGRSETAERLGIHAELFLVDGRVRVLLDVVPGGALSLQ